MTKVLFVIPSLEYSGLARRLTLLAVNLPRDRFQVRVAVLGGPSPWGNALRNAGIVVDELGWRRPFDAHPLFALRRLAAEMNPKILHAWGEAALRAALIAGIGTSGRVIASGVLPAARHPGWLVRGLLSRVGHVIAFGRTEAESYRQCGVPSEKLTEAPLATDPNWPLATPESAIRLPAEDGRVILGVGPLHGHKGFRDAVWTFDILHFLYDDLRLILAGPGPDRTRVEAFARVTGTHGRIHCTGPLADLSPLRRRALLAWIPGRPGGVQAALEAMAAGLPMVASRTPRIAEAVVHGETGFLAAPGDKADFARQTRLLLDDGSRREAIAEAGRRRATEQFAPGPMAEACARAYGG